MTCQEFSDQFDVLYNNITSNQAPGLDEYEKSVFLTRAQNEILLAYFDARLNKSMAGFDMSQKRQIDFSGVLRTESFIDESQISAAALYIDDDTDVSNLDLAGVGLVLMYADGTISVGDFSSTDISEVSTIEVNPGDIYYITDDDGNTTYYIATRSSGWKTADSIVTLRDAILDLHDNSKGIYLGDASNKILVIINEFVNVERNDKTIQLPVTPITYLEYMRLMSKPFKRPFHYQAWRVITGSESEGDLCDLVVNPTDEILKYTLRYVKRPNAIIVADLDDSVSIDGSSSQQECELDDALHPEILQRAVELAKAAYVGDINTIIGVGANSQTNMGLVGGGSGSKERD